MCRAGAFKVPAAGGYRTQVALPERPNPAPVVPAPPRARERIDSLTWRIEQTFEQYALRQDFAAGEHALRQLLPFLARPTSIELQGSAQDSISVDRGFSFNRGVQK